MTMDTMQEATRLTREGRLSEAMTLLREMLSRGGTEAAEPKAASPEMRDGHPVIDLVPPAAGETAWKAGPEPTAPRKAAKAAPMGGLGQVLAGLRRRAPAPVVLPEGARFETHAFANAAGRRTYKLYVPSGYAGRPMPLVVMLHGCTQNPDDFAAGTGMNALAEEFGMLVAYPEQPRSANPNLCWNWFNPADQRRDAGEPSILAGITRAIMTEYSVDSDRVFVAGLSAGGAAASVLGGAYPDLFAAIGVHSGLAQGAASDLPSALAAMKSGGRGAPIARPGPSGRAVRAIVFHGDRDHTVAPINGDQVAAQFAGAGRGESRSDGSHGDRGYTRIVRRDGEGKPLVEHWTIHGAGHAWSGGNPAGSHADAKGPDASREMVRFFLEA